MVYTICVGVGFFEVIYFVCLTVWLGGRLGFCCDFTCGLIVRVVGFWLGGFVFFVNFAVC